MPIVNTGLKRKPTHPGEMLREDFMPEYGLTATAMADAIGVSCQLINELPRERRALNSEMAIRLGKLFGNTEDFWLNVQCEFDQLDSIKV